MNIIEAIEDQHLFGSLFKDPQTWAAWRVFLKAVFGLAMTGGECELFQKCTGRQQPPAEQVEECFAIVGRRGGKSFMAAVIACYLALFRDWTPFLTAGEMAWIMVISTDRPQARNILGYIKGILQASPMFKGLLDKDLTWEISLSNGVGVKVATCDYRTLRGYTVAGAVLDELAYWRSEGANPAQEILTALRPALATVSGSMLIGISSPYSKSGVLYEAFRDKYGQDEKDTLVWKAPTAVMNPTIKDKVIARALKADYAAARAEWLAEFRDDLQSYLTTEMIEAVVVRDRFELPKTEGMSYQAFTDPSGGRADSFTLAIAHREALSGKYVLDRLEERKPPFAPQGVVKEFAVMLKSYGVSSVIGDKYAGEWVTKAFEAEGICYFSSEKNKSEIYLEFEPLVAQGQVEILDSRELFNQLRGLERRTRSGGKDQVDHCPGGHDDVANVAAGACVACAGNSGDFGFEAHGSDRDADEGRDIGSIEKGLPGFEKALIDELRDDEKSLLNTILNKN